MGEQIKYKLAYDLYGSLIVFDKNNQISLAGDSILKELSRKEIDIYDIVINNFSDKESQNLLTTIEKVRSNHRSYVFKFKKSEHEFILFPGNTADKGTVFLSLKKAVEHINKIEHDLRERVKELECLYNITDELQDSKDITEAFEKSTEHIKRGFQYPQEISVVIEYNGKKFINSGGTETKIKNLLSDENILKNKEKRGEIRVIYHKKLPFLKEEIKLIKEISNRFTKAIEKEEKTKALEYQKKVLISRNKTLTELTKKYRQNKNQLQTFFKAITDKIIVIDNQNNIILSNRDDIGNSGKCFEKLFDYQQPCQDCPSFETFKTKKYASLHKEFSNNFYVLRSYPIFDDDGNVDRVLEVCRNNTKEKKMEYQLLESHKFASLGKLVAGVAHEINNPNTFILGNIKIIKEAFADILPIIDEKYITNPDLKLARLNYDLFKENISILIDDIYNGAVKIKKFVEELRNFAKKDEEILSDPMNINEIIERTVRLLKKQIKENVKIKLDLNPELPIVQGSISKIEQVIINLILNAAQAIGVDNGEITVLTGNDSKNNQITIVVRDNGKGMDEKTQKNIFDPFFTTKRNEGGIGLGLSISYRIIKDHKGEIEVDSQLGKGTTFLINLPVN